MVAFTPSTVISVLNIKYLNVQLLVLFAAVPPLVSTVKLVCPRYTTREIPAAILNFYIVCHWVVVIFWFPCWLSMVVDNAHRCIHSRIHNGPDDVCKFCFGSICQP